MSAARTATCAFVAAVLAGAVAAQSQAVAPVNVASPWVDQPPGEWSLAVNTATGKVGATLKQVR